ncbi:MAG: LytR/AlgR family response regulator transcription factor [Marinifilaceae bacterium]
MPNLHVAIIEDEIPAARLLFSVIHRLRPEWNLELLPGSVEELVEWFEVNKHPDLLFLDIQLSDGNSFEFLNKSKPSSSIVFTTAYDEYAIRAFTVNSIDYILKPVDEDRLLEAIEKYEHRMETGNSRLQSQLDALLQTMQQQKKFRTRFLIAAPDKFITLQVDDVAYFFSENKVTYAVTFSGKKHAIDLPLEKLTEQLNPDLFFRANRQVLLSINSIKRIEPYFNGKIIVIVQPPFEDKITISKEKISAFKMWLNF